MKYNECKILCEIKRKKEPLVTKVPVDEFTKMVSANFDYDFNGESKFYPFELPEKIKHCDFDILVICGASGSGKSTLLKEFGRRLENKRFKDGMAIVSSFNSPEEAGYKLSAVGLNSIPVWCRPRNVLSVGEGFRADIALNLESGTIFDEFTSTIDRNVAKSTCNGLQKYIRKNGLKGMVFCSCHKDHIPFLKPDVVVDLDDEKCYDCRGVDLGELSPSKCTDVKTRTFGGFLGNITI